MTTKMRYFLLFAAVLPALLNAQVLRIVSFTRDTLTGNYDLTWANQPTSVYCGLLFAYSLDDGFWLPVASPLWNFRTTNTTTTLQQLGFSSPKAFLRIVCSTNPMSCLSYPHFQVPFSNISVDGSPADWAGIQPAVTDPAGDAYLGPAGSDITALYLARDSTNVYLRIDVANGPPDNPVSFNLSFYTNCVFYAGDRFVSINFWAPQCAVEQYACSTSGGCHSTVAVGRLAVNGNVIEASVPVSALNPPSPSYVRANSGAFDTTSYVEATFP
ncbi:MAG: hypothetical protein NT154_43655 [Verrucomicrobia bacterium]|nr:hypothetical protein [Verrucomicrobiota bacterium]